MSYDVRFVDNFSNRSLHSVSYYHWNGVLLPKTKVNGGYCYIDYDHVDACLLRPIFKADPGKTLLG